ncbi:MAG TPA: OsmC family peroxiredoxin [Gemmatimonadota bacterium]|nr:OsmC family peroxiredoxin [Gemmatimonadota bacterium]
MPTRKASAEWRGGLKEGQGTLKLGSGAYEGPYSFRSRFQEGTGTNPEELIGAAHAACYAMALSAGLEKAGHPAERVSVTSRIEFDTGGDAPTIRASALEVEAVVPGIDQEGFLDQAEAAKKGCPVSRALGGVEIRLDARLAG